jgi:iron complex outermembrane recepter protein
MKLMKSAMTTVCAFALAGGVRAQQVGVAQAQETDSTALQEIVVSAQRRSENLQNVPIVVTSISSEQLKASGITDLSQINTLVPGLTLRQAAGDVQTSIRGVGASINGGENTAAIYIDDVYLPLQRDGLRELPDVEQISVLKGPQGTLFGRNATAGVIQITTLQPTQEFHVSGDATLGNYQTRSADAFVSGGLAENLAGSLSVRYDGQGEGYGRNLFTGNGANQLRHSYQARGKLVFDPGTDTKITIAADYLDRDAYLHSLHQTPGTSFFLPAPPVENQHDYYSQVDSKYTVQTGGASLKIEHSLDVAT